MPTNKQQREAAKRKLERQLERRRQREAQRRRIALISTIVGTLVVLAVVIVSVVMLTSDNKKSNAGAQPTNSTSASPSASTGMPGDCTYTAGGTAARKVKLPAAKAATSGVLKAVVKTTRGDLTFTMDRAKAPCTVASFESLSLQKYYDNTPCHRLTTIGIYVLQCGDPTGAGTGGPGYTIPDEYTGTEKYTAGVLAMANTGAPNSGGGQFFIVYKDTQLPAKYTVFGTVTQGLDVVTKVAAKGSDNSNGNGDGHPKLPIKITSVTFNQ